MLVWPLDSTFAYALHEKAGQRANNSRTLPSSMLKLPNNGSNGNDGVCIWAKDKCSSGSGNDNNTDVLACEYNRFFSNRASKDVSRGGTSATQRRKFHIDEVKSVRNPVISADWTTE